MNNIMSLIERGRILIDISLLRSAKR
jgi:hypothetical protein